MACLVAWLFCNPPDPLAIRTHSLPPLRHRSHRSCLSEARPWILVSGHPCSRLLSSGLSRPGALRTVPGLATCSSAFCGTFREPDVLKPLRSAWLRRLQTPGLLSGLLAHLVSPSKDPPLSESALHPFLADLRAFLCVRDDATWAKLLHVDPGQPFRLSLWHCLSVLTRDPDMDFFRLLHEGVVLGIGELIPPCKVLLPPGPPAESILPLQHCDSAWKSALDHADLVDGLLHAEIQEGWIRPVPGGDAALRKQYTSTQLLVN